MVRIAWLGHPIRLVSPLGGMGLHVLRIVIFMFILVDRGCFVIGRCLFVWLCHVDVSWFAMLCLYCGCGDSDRVWLYVVKLGFAD